MTMPEMTKPVIGDILTMVRHKTRYHEEQITKVTVTKVARYKITVEDPDRPSYLSPLEFDIRTGAVWDTTPTAKRVGSHPRTLFTEEQLSYWRRAVAADEYFRSRSISVWSIRGGLCDAIRDNKIGFANILRQFEGLDEI